MAARDFAYYLGLDLGQSADYTALALIEQPVWVSGRGTSPARRDRRQSHPRRAGRGGRRADRAGRLGVGGGGLARDEGPPALRPCAREVGSGTTAEPPLER